MVLYIINAISMNICGWVYILREQFVTCKFCSGMSVNLCVEAGKGTPRDTRGNGRWDRLLWICVGKLLKGIICVLWILMVA